MNLKRFLLMEKCKHKNLTDYSNWGHCSTEYCSGWEESHCRDCGAFLCECPCGTNNSMDIVSTRFRKMIARRETKYERENPS